MLTGTLMPAYGRVLNSKNAVLTAWNGGSDFTISSMQGTTICSKRDFEPGQRIQLRYGKPGRMARGIPPKVMMVTA